MGFVVGFGHGEPGTFGDTEAGVDAWNEWRRTTTEKADLNGADLSGSNLIRANLIGADITHADLRKADLLIADLSGADLTGAKLSQANLNGAKFNKAILVKAKLVRSELAAASFRAADLTEASLSKANLRRARLSEANLSGAELIDANLRDADLSSTNLTGSTFGDTVFVNLDLSSTRGLESVIHRAPSTIGIDTLYKSKGKIPEVFLRGCGVPDSFIAQAKALIGAEEGIQFYSCFISYSGLDEEFARRLHGRLQQEHVRVWFAPHDMQGGKKLHEQIDEAIKVYDKLLILLSPNSLQSEWVMTELRKARKAERKTGKRKLFPVGMVDYKTLQEWECFDADGGKDLAVEVREYFIPDFSNWKDHDSFEKGFARLLKDLRAEQKAA